MELIQSVYLHGDESLLGIGTIPGVLNQINPQLSKHTIIIEGQYLVLPQKPCNAVLDYIRSQTHY